MTDITIHSTIDFTPPQLDRLRGVAPNIRVEQHPGAMVDDVPAGLRDRVDILYGWGKTVADGHRYPNLKWLQTHSAGIDTLLDTPLWRSPVVISSLNGIHATPIAEHALALMLAFRWRLPAMQRLQQQAEWPQGRWDIFTHPELRGSTLGIVGYGAIGRELARLASALGMRVLAANRSGQRRPFGGYSEPGIGDPAAAIPAEIYPTSRLPQMLPHCDYVVLLAPLTPQSRHLLNRETLAAMKPTAYLFNMGRGPLVDEAALADALRQRLIAGAGLDVFETEPLPAGSPLWALDNAIISPHVSGFTPHYDERASELFAANLRRFLNGETLINQVDKTRGY
ncbi:MAG: D-2-hydroxyacid dehydrogenase [Anaerolineae bacterium]